MLKPSLALSGKRIGTRVFGGGVREENRVTAVGAEGTSLREEKG